MQIIAVYMQDVRLKAGYRDLTLDRTSVLNPKETVMVSKER